MGVPVTVAMGNAYYVFFVPMVIAMHMPMPTVMGMPVTMCTGTSTIGKHAPRTTHGDRFTVTVIKEDEDHVTYELTSRVISFKVTASNFEPHL